MSTQFDQVSYIYQQGTPYEFEATKNASLTFEQGECYAIIGQAGNGESTLIQHLNALLKPATGSVSTNGLEVTDRAKDKHLHHIKKGVGIVFQFPKSQLFKDSVEKEIEFGPKNFNMDLKNVKDKAFQLLLELGFLRNVMPSSPFQMPGGQMRKITIVSILATDPQVIILDEPTAGLNPNSKYQVMSLIKKVQVEENRTIIPVSHDMGDVARYSDEVIVMNKRMIVEKSNPRDLFNQKTQLLKWYIELPEVVKLQKDIKKKCSVLFPKLAANEEEFVKLYKEWHREKQVNHWMISSYAIDYSST